MPIFKLECEALQSVFFSFSISKGQLDIPAVALCKSVASNENLLQTIRR